jgi:hypothetical protein
MAARLLLAGALAACTAGIAAALGIPNVCTDLNIGTQPGISDVMLYGVVRRGPMCVLRPCARSFPLAAVRSAICSV